MSEALPEPTAPEPSAEPQAPEPAAKPRGRKRAAVRRWVKRTVLVVAALLAAIFITIFSVDIGNISVNGRSLRTVAEARGTEFMGRPLRIGRISALLTPGKFALDDVVIEGPTKDDRPFFSAKRIIVEIPWWAVLPGRRELFLDVRLSGWRMVVENWAVGGARLPRLRPRGESRGPSTIRVRTLDVYANDGEFIFDDHVNNWSITARNLKFALVRASNLNTYVGTAEFSNGTTQLMKFQPMRTDFSTRFQLEGSKVRLHHIDLLTDGARSHVNGYVNFANWPEQEYNVSSEVDFARMRQIFFGPGDWRLSGDGTFRGIFKFSKAGRELKGQFESEEAGLGMGKTEWRFPHLHGALEWTAQRFIVTHAESDLLGGEMRLSYGLAPLGTPRGATATLTADYQNVDVYRFTRQFDFTALEPQGRMRGKVALSWPNSNWAARQGSGETFISPPEGAPVASATLPATAEPVTREPREGFVKFKPFGFFPLAADMKYRFTASALDFEPSWAATPTEYVTFSGHARGGPVDVPFHVTSHDWQASDRLFTAIMTNFKSQIGAIPVGGRGTFDGRLTGAFNKPRIVGRFAGDHMYAWDQDWGLASGDVAIENGYMDIVNGEISHGSGGKVFTSGRYSLGYPRADGGEEIDASIRVENMPLEPMKKAFDLDDWPITGTVATASMHLKGKYEQPGDLGKPGSMTIVNGTAWDEPFESVTSGLVFEGNGSLRLRAMRMQKAGGNITGDAWVSWEENRYSFQASTEGTGIPVDKLANFRIDRAPLTGQLTFKARGDGSFDSPEWSLNGTIADLYAGGEGIGVVVGTLSVSDETLKMNVTADSLNRLRMTGGGVIKLNDAYDATLHMTLTETSIEPYLKFFMQELPYTRAVVGGRLSLNGPLADPKKLTANATIEKANLTLFDYPLENDGDIQLALKNNVFTLERVRFKGEGTENLEFSGTIDGTARTADVKAGGRASLAILQAFYPDLSARGSAALSASLTGSFDKFAVNGQADIADGVLRHPALPHRFYEINGPIVMRDGRISIGGLRATMAEGPVRFAGDIRLDGYRPAEYALEAHGRSLNLRLLDLGLRATVDADLFLNGPIKEPVLSGNIYVIRAAYSPRVQNRPGYFDLLTGAVEPELPSEPVFAAEAANPFPLRFDIHVRSGVLPFIENNADAIYGSADVQITGSSPKPVVTGQVRLDRGTWTFSGNRYRLQGGRIDFSNPLDFDPFFDVSASTRVRTPGQYYDVNLRLSGTQDKLDFSITSEPWLPEFQVIAMLLGETPAVGRAELLARNAPQELQNQALRAAGATFLASPITATVGGVAERLTGIDTVQLVPVLGNDPNLQQLSPTARITLGKRVSERFYLTYSRTLSTSTQLQNEIILIEFDQNDQVSWILSRNEDRSFALDFRIKHVFK